jgi:hypothetical protein
MQLFAKTPAIPSLKFGEHSRPGCCSACPRAEPERSETQPNGSMFARVIVGREGATHCARGGRTPSPFLIWFLPLVPTAQPDISSHKVAGNNPQKTSPSRRDDGNITRSRRHQSAPSIQNLSQNPKALPTRERLGLR